jgi:hypothetical protein
MDMMPTIAVSFLSERSRPAQIPDEWQLLCASFLSSAACLRVTFAEYCSSARENLLFEI